MLTHIPYSSLGTAKYGWLTAKYHFSFAHYYNPKRMGFGALRVINDDLIAGRSGFPPHPHQNMEIITFIRRGELTHQDNQGNKGSIKAGEVQVMSAGAGIVHSEYNLTDQHLSLYQIWINTNQLNVQPRWDSKVFSNKINHHLPLLVSGNKNDVDALFIHQDVRIYGGKIAKGSNIEVEIKHQAYVLASEGSFTVATATQTIELNAGDGAEVTDTKNITLTVTQDSEIIVIDVADV